MMRRPVSVTVMAGVMILTGAFLVACAVFLMITSGNMLGSILEILIKPESPLLQSEIESHIFMISVASGIFGVIMLIAGHFSLRGWVVSWYVNTVLLSLLSVLFFVIMLMTIEPLALLLLICFSTMAFKMFSADVKEFLKIYW